jgi:hypothetical protein
MIDMLMELGEHLALYHPHLWAQIQAGQADTYDWGTVQRKVTSGAEEE